MYNLTEDEIELLAYFSKLNERNQGRMIQHCLNALSEQLLDDYKSFMQKDSRSTLEK
ncbi:MAG: hypothetical protein K2J08_01030 [Ruminococcus sp.]|nr:hypothetical protein [Ruminococcus sp.]